MNFRSVILFIFLFSVGNQLLASDMGGKAEDRKEFSAWDVWKAVCTKSAADFRGEEGRILEKVRTAFSAEFIIAVEIVSSILNNTGWDVAAKKMLQAHFLAIASPDWKSITDTAAIKSPLKKKIYKMIQSKCLLATYNFVVGSREIVVSSIYADWHRASTLSHSTGLSAFTELSTPPASDTLDTDDGRDSPPLPAKRGGSIASADLVGYDEKTDTLISRAPFASIDFELIKKEKTKE